MTKKYNNVDEYALDVEGKTFSELNDREKANTESAFAGYLQKNNLQETYDSAIKELDSDLQSNQRTAYFNNEKIMKYLPNNLKVQGLQNNIGAQNQAYIDANNSYQTNLNTITQDYNKNKTTMLNDYNTNIMAIDESVRQEQKVNNEKYDQIEREDSLLQKEVDRENDIALTDSQRVNLDAYYQSLIGDDGKISNTDYQNLAKYAEELSVNLSDSGKTQINSLLDGYKVVVRDKKEQEEIDNAKAEQDAKDYVVENYGVSSETPAIKSSTADVYSFGKFTDTGTGEGYQDAYVNEVLNMAKSNGLIVDFNWGAGKSANYIYYNGYWFKTDKKAIFDYKDSNTYNEKLNKDKSKTKTYLGGSRR